MKPGRGFASEASRPWADSASGRTSIRTKRCTAGCGPAKRSARRDDTGPAPNLLVVRASDASVHDRWLVGDRNFDVMVSYSGSQEGRFSQNIEYYHAMKGPQWPSVHALFTHYMNLFGDYARIGIVLDDIDANARIWSTLFHLCEWYGLDAVHPSVVGHAATAVTGPQEGSILRYM